MNGQSGNKGWSRRRMIRAAGAAAALRCIGATEPSLAQPGDAPLEVRRLVAANRILATENVVDAFGHVSVRDPKDAARFIMSRSLSPALVTHEDLLEFTLDGEAVDLRGRVVYGERMIHAAVYAARPDVGAVVHHHSYAVLPFTITGAPLVPVIHTASIIGAEIPVWDIRERFGDTDMLVRTLEQGRDLAARLGPHTCLLMRGHGAVVAGATVREAVLAAIYLQVNASVLLEASRLGDAVPLSRAEIERSTEAQFSPLAMERAWQYFCSRAGVEPL